jgi:hypothetical protein
MEWVLVVSHHETVFHDKFYSKETIKLKFAQLKDTKPGTSTVFVPTVIEKAKNVWQDILAKMGGNEGNDKDGEAEIKEERSKDKDYKSDDDEDLSHVG